MDTNDRNSGNMAQGSKFNLIRVFCLCVCVLGGSVQLFLLLLLMFETRSHSIGLAGLELTIETRLAWDSEIYLLCLPSAWVKGVRHHAWSL